jgi:hypothetical protein
VTILFPLLSATGNIAYSIASGKLLSPLYEE